MSKQVTCQEGIMDLKSVKAFRSKDEYLVAMKEDLAEWLSDLHAVDADVDNFFDVLDSGCLLCTHANMMLSHMHQSQPPLPFRDNAKVGSFQARDNLSLFISFCRKELNIPDTLLFESEDLVCRKNERSVVLCLLEVGRRGASFGVMVPQLVRLEQEIDQQIATELNAVTSTSNNSLSCNTTTKNNCTASNTSIPTYKTPSFANVQSHYKHHKTSSSQEMKDTMKRMKPVVEVDMMTLDEMVRLILGRCTCEVQYPMLRLSEGKYTYGDNLTAVFLRVLRRHVMVRTGGGWDTLESFLGRHDPCRCNSKDHRGALAFKNAFQKQSPSEASSSSSAAAAQSASEKSDHHHQDDLPTLHLLNNVKHLISDTRACKVTTPTSSRVASCSKQRFKTHSKLSATLSSKSLHSSTDRLAPSRRPSIQLPCKTSARNKATLSKDLNVTSSSPSSSETSSRVITIKTPSRRPQSATCGQKGKALSAVPVGSISKTNIYSSGTCKALNKSCKSLNASKENLLSHSSNLPHTPSCRAIPHSTTFTCSGRHALNNNRQHTLPTFKTPFRPVSGRPGKKNQRSSSVVASSSGRLQAACSVEELTGDRRSHATPTKVTASLRRRKDVLTCSGITRIPAPVLLQGSRDSLRRSDSGVDITGEDVDHKASPLFFGKDFY